MIESENPDPFEDEEDEDKYRLQARPSGLGFVQDSVMHRIDAFLSEKHVSSGVGMNFVERIDHFLSGGLGLSESSGKEMGIEGFAGTGRFMDKSECDCDDCDDCDCSGLDESEGPKYEGPALEKGGTSIAGKAAPAVREMLGTQVKAGMKVLDYGAGKYARNADFFREAGVEVYAYDPFGGVSGVDGWETGKISKVLPPPGTDFDLAFSAYVLNVVPDHIEDDIIADMKRFSSKQVHITRNTDIADTVKKALSRGDSDVTAFYLKHFAPRYPGAAEELEETGGAISKKTLMAFCGFGVKTSRGFQRIPELENKGFRRTKMKAGYKVFEK